MRLPWYAEQKLSQGAFATFLGLTLHRNRLSSSLSWDCTAIGDSCLFQVRGARVITAGSGEAALDSLERMRPDALIADLGMPGIDGFELIARIRRSGNAGVRNVPAIAVTAYARSEDRTRALRQGFQMHLAKPIDPAELVAAITSLRRQSNTTAS